MIPLTTRTDHVSDEAFAVELRASLEAIADDEASPLLAVFARNGLLSRFAEPAPAGGYCHSEDWRAVLNCLSTIGGIDLSMARLFEGHLNAMQLVALYGSQAQQSRVLAMVLAGGMLGVWGAEGPQPVRLDQLDGEQWRLTGSKRYASGVGLLTMALVPVTQSDGRMQLLLLRTDDPARCDVSSWDHRGMRRTASGTFDCDGIVVGADDFIGECDDYRREPDFVGGIWRCAAAQLGAIEAIVKAMAVELHSNGRDQHPLQMARIGEAILAARTARLWVEESAARVENSPPDADAKTVARTVSISAYGRLATEKAAMAVIDLAERALGLGSFAVSHPVERLSRDLAVYIRQANPDAVLLGHGRVLAAELHA